MEAQIILLDLVTPSRNRQCSEFPKNSMNNLTKRRVRAYLVNTYQKWITGNGIFIFY